ncbi:response regulator with CheY-like receiver, AAA-type ATPase, and DNA-binding domains [Desulfitobacterium dehalogenans ATCC 51507]|uniref:Stage 0 sporulation protein A homolog n=1 Tax=Desulfitobacterium dehalogenans (strain ATCC 51507 / DSM 9161 / JW/IU-DC1) TaxID=756499 RepID=I4AEF9_DESDJ|nr:sigma-54 dependent transcriptional regulator [Desulfitobacterium dehalogenans]AFM02344.1 response regulator with CheY-like receiver, AAA-type ATPase, and DNA-binding domains [Desulfitobacterium dehalogenans ATCC 51507]
MNSHQSILILDDEEDLRSILAQRLGRRGYEISEAGTAQEGMALLQENIFEAVLLDIRLPDGDGLQLLQEMKKRQPDLQVIMLTGHGTLESAIEAMKAGAYDYLTKPCNLSELEITLQKALEQRKLMLENTGLRQVVHRQNAEPLIVGDSEIMQSLKEMTRKIAQTDTPVLIQGESGTGKELFARALHVWGPRRAQAYIPLNAGAVHETLMESELFGHEKGAFTGANAVKLGLVEMADQGTLFLDEIGEMPLNLQVKLLRFMETGEFRRVGDNRLRRVNVRIVTATNRNLLEEVEAGRFRKDLYYRLSGMVLHIPPLRERKGDILQLAEHFLRVRLKGQLHLALGTQEALLAYDFPGNVRELAHLIERGMILAEGDVIHPGDLWPDHGEGGGSVQAAIPVPDEGTVMDEKDLKTRNEENQSESLEGYATLAEIEKNYILATLKKVDGNKVRAARLLSISVRNLYRKLEEYS